MILTLAAIVSIFASYSIQPGSIARAALSTPPKVISTSPAENAVGVAVRPVITATFNVPMDAASIDATTFTLTPSGGAAVAGVVTLQSSGKVASIRPAANLKYATVYTAAITTGAKSATGVALAHEYKWSFTTARAPVPKVTSTFPANGASEVPIGSVVTAVFSLPMDAASISSATFKVMRGSTAVSGKVAYSTNSSVASFTPAAALEFNTHYVAMITTGARDSSGVALAAGYKWSFTTAPPTADQRADALLAKMTQSEKLSLVQGGVTSNLTYGYTVPRGAAGYVPGIASLGIPELYLADGSVGVGNGVGPATALPSSIASAAGWDVVEAGKYGQVIGSELADYGINVNLGGNVNLIGREPRDGRTFETKGEDPILAGKIAAAHISAIQANHIVGDIKHFAFNDSETGRSTQNAIISDRGGRESDLLAFEIGVKDSNVQSVMCSYNLTNGTYDCENNQLLNGVLKGDWGFQGFVMSDWWATHSTANAANSGLDQEQPNQQYFSTLGQAVSAGQVPQARLDNMVHRILRAMFEVGIFDYPQKLQPIPAAADAQVAKEIEELGAVLLRNAGNQLPLNAATTKSIAVIGTHADVAVLSGGGSAQVQPVGGALKEGYPCPPCWAQVEWDLSSPLQAIQAAAPKASVQFSDGSDVTAAAALASSAQVAIVFVSQWDSEGMDETTLSLTDLTNATPIDQDALVSAVAAANPHTIVVVESGGAVLMPWLDQVSAVLEAWFPGQSGGPAIADLLFGNANPSGKLPITFPASDAQLPRPEIPQPPDNVTPFPVNLFEGYNVGYKWFDSQRLTPLFPFGFGLSYTSFSITDAALVNHLAVTSNPNFEVTFNLTNTGALAGAEVAQVYLGMPASTNEPPRRLVGWQKTMLQPGASQSVTIEVDQNDSSHPMSYWDTASSSWQVAPGVYTVYLGTSSSSASLSKVGTITVGP
jgi:beta-glucosidase